MTKPVYMVSIATYISADTPEQAALLFQDMFQDGEHPGWGIRVVDTKSNISHFIDTETLADRRDEIMGDEALDTDPL